MRTLLNNGCALAYVNSVGEPLADKIPDYMGLEVSLPKLVCRNSFDLTISYKRIGIASPLNSKFVVYREIERAVTDRFKPFGKLTIICSEESLNSVSNILDLNMKNEIDAKVCKVIKSVLGNEFKVTDSMYYFNVDISGMAFGNSDTKGVGDDAFDNIVYRYLHNRYMQSLLLDNWVYSKHHSDESKHICNNFKNSSKEALEHLKGLGVKLSSGAYGSKEVAYLNSAFYLTDIREDYNFYPKCESYVPRLVKSYKEEVDSKVITKDRITKMFKSIADEMASEVMDLVKPNDYGLGMSRKSMSMMCDYNLDFAMAFGYARYIFSNGRNVEIFNDYMREAIEKYKDTANTYLLEFVDIIRTSYRDNKLDIGNKFELEEDGNVVKAKFKSAGVLEPKYLKFVYDLK